MKGSANREEVEIKQKYVFFSDPEIIAKRAEKSGGILQNQQIVQLRQHGQQCASQPALGNIANRSLASDPKNVESFLIHQPVQPYPFTFITAVKQKLALAAFNETSKKAYNSISAKTLEPLDIHIKQIDASSQERLYQTVQKMDFVKPLKVPDVKISPKTLDYSPKDTQNLRDVTSLKISMTSASQKLEKMPKSMERVQRKLDFSLSEGHSFISCDDIEPLKAPDLSISPSLTKQREHTRDNSREKENRIKRMRKDDSGVLKIDEISQECPKRVKNPKHVSRKDVAESKRSKNERSSSHLPKDTEFTSKKPKSKNFAISTAKKDDEKRIRSTSIHTMKISRERSLESRGRTFSNESLTDRSSKVHEKNIGRENSRGGTDTDASVLKYNDDYEILNALRQIEEQKQKSVIDAKPPKTVLRSSLQLMQQKSNEISAKEQHKRISDRTKASTSKCQVRPGSSASEILEDIENPSDSNSTKNRSICTESSQHSKNSKILDPTDSQRNTESQSLTEGSSGEMIIDPIKISFRDDSYSQQEEFYDLVTPDMNLTLRSRRRKPPIKESEPEMELKTPKYKSSRTSESAQNVEATPMVHPTALHMQFQAELHLFDSYNESLRQVMDVEKCLYTVKHDRGKELLEKQKFVNEEMKKHLTAMQAERDSVDLITPKLPIDEDFSRGRALENEAKNGANTGGNETTKLPDLREELEVNSRKFNVRLEAETRDTKPDVKVAEVQTQTANDIATQTDTRIARHIVANRLKQYPGITYERGDFLKCDIPELSLGSLEQFEDLDHIEDISLPSKMRAMSEISLHETTSSIKTETGTEISISTRDVTCSFNKYLDLEMAQLIKDEKLMYDKIEMLFKSREKTLNDRTRKLVKLEEQKRALRDTGQDSRISSVKKKQRALLLKLQQEKDEMNRLKELHKIASQERKLMLQKQRNMFNPQMSTKNILTKLKRSADCQSPRRLSGPMKGYDIRSNSSMSSLVDSDKSQLDRSQIDLKLQLSDSSHRLEGKSLKSDLENSAPEKIDTTKNRRYMSVLGTSSNSLNNLDQLNEFTTSFDTPQKLESKARKFEEKMPNLKSNYLIRQKQTIPPSHGQIVEMSEIPKIPSQNIDNSENVKSESDTLVEELSKKSKPQNFDSNAHISVPTKDKESVIIETVQGEADSINSRKSRASQVTEESISMNYKGSKKGDKIFPPEREGSKKSQHPHEIKSSSKRKGAKSVKGKSASNVLTENILRSKSNNSEDIVKSGNKRTKTEKDSSLPDDNYQSSILEELDLNESQNSLQALVKHSRAVKDKNYKLLRDIASEHETKENILTRNMMERSSENRENDSRRDDGDVHNLGNISTRSQVSTFTISRHSSGDSEKSYSRSVVIRAQDHRFKTSKKLEQALNDREAALTTRRNCVEDWIAWHTKLKAEESRVARMEQAAFKLVSTTANTLPYHDTTMSSDTSDVEGRVELLAEKLAERRVEMSKLKREARRQAKQRLKALEANLLNQIKKYDTTIHEMRKKLETQKGSIKDSDKLAIESRSVSDFKVPEIPIKRIQEIYKSSDLLRSRSESDLIFSKRSHEETDRNVGTMDNHERSRESLYKSSSLRDSKNSRISRLSSARTNQSAESIFEEAKIFSYGNSEKHSEASSDRESQTASKSQESIEDATSLQNIPVTLAINEPETIPNEVKANVSVTTETGEISTAIQTSGTNGSSKLFSRKLESLQLTNKNLNDDISTLENDLKALSEMMSHFSKKSDEKLISGSLPVIDQDDIVTIADSSAKSTSRDISEELSKSVCSEIIEEILIAGEDLERPMSVQSNDFIPEQSEIQGLLEKSQSSEGSKSHEKLNDEVTEVISAIMPDGESSEMRPSEEIDFEARSKEILNVIEKSIISERVKSPSTELNLSGLALEKSMMEMHGENEALSQDLNSLEGDIKSISKIISKRAKSKRNVGLAADSSEISYSSEDNLEPLEDTFEMPILQLSNENQFLEITDNESHDGHYENEKVDEIQDEILLEPTYATEEKSVQESEREKSVKMSVKYEIYDAGEIIDNSNIPDDITKSLDEDEPESIGEEFSSSHHDDILYNETSLLSRKSNETTEQNEAEEDKRSNESSLENSVNENNEESRENDGISIGKASVNNDWTISDSFEVPEKPEDIVDEFEKSSQPEERISIQNSELSIANFSEESREHESPDDRREIENFTCDMEDVSMFVPKGESTNICYKFEDSMINITRTDSMQTDELDDILDIIARESKQTEASCRQQIPEIAVTIENNAETVVSKPHNVPIVTSDRIIPRPSDLNLTAEVEPVLQKLTEILQGVERNIARRRKNGNEGNRESAPEVVESRVSSAPTSESALATKISSFATEKLDPQSPEIVESTVPSEPTSESALASKISFFETEKLDQQTSEIDNRVLEIIPIAVDQEIPEVALPVSVEIVKESLEEIRQETKSPSQVDEESSIRDDAKFPAIPETISKLPEKTFEILRDPEYEDISEESLEVSEILDRSESQRSGSLSKNYKIPDKYEVTQKSEDVLRILDEISQKSYGRTDNKKYQHLNDVQISVQVFGSVSPGFTNKRVSLLNEEIAGRAIGVITDDIKSVEVEIVSRIDKSNRDEESLGDDDVRGKYSRKDQQDEIFRKQEVDGSSESSEGADTPRGVSEIEMDSPRDPNESRLDIDVLDDDLLSVGDSTKQQSDANVEFPVASTIVTSEKDIEAMIDKLKASLEQPGLEVAELEAKLLRIEQLQIELEIKKLEAEEVTFYVREIPNKPPPPYTPPGGGRLATPQASPTLPPAVVPSNVEELTAFTEKATVLIFNAKNCGEDITTLQPPLEICELSKDNIEIAKQDRRIYNTFLFDLCKETIAELYRSEYERPGPSWTKPNVKTKPAMKIPKTVEELNEYVSKEVATLFGFKTKLQRENMVMRWSRKRRDRVDELLAREAQAEEDEWTKFHHDELAVKNELTVAILDTLILETANVVKAVYAKKRKVAVA